MCDVSIKNESDYNQVMDKIQKILDRADKKGGFEKLDSLDKEILYHLSLTAEKWEDSLKLFPL